MHVSQAIALILSMILKCWIKIEVYQFVEYLMVEKEFYANETQLIFGTISKFVLLDLGGATSCAVSTC